MNKRVKYTKGDKWNMLTYISDVASSLRGNDSIKRRRCLFKCDCGNEHVTEIYPVKSGKIRSCGCSKDKVKYSQESKWNRLTFNEELEPITYGKSEKPRRCAKFLCECGNFHAATIESVRAGKTKSCGCLNTESRSASGMLRRTHGMSKNPLYKTWQRMKQRCHNPNNGDYPNYGGRGIVVEDSWRTCFEAFYRDMHSTFEDGLELDRIDVNSNYCKDNCRWVTECMQAYNQRRYKSNTSGRTGVTSSSKGDKWEVRISYKGVEEYLGTTNSFEEAVKLRELFEIKYYGYIKETL